MTTHRIDGGLQFGHRLEGDEEEEEGEGDEKNIFVDKSFFTFTFCFRHRLGFPLKSERSTW